MRLTALLAAFILSLAAFAAPIHAKTLSPVGSWSGGGKVVPNNGIAERTRCRATVRAAGKNSFSASLECAVNGAQYNGSATLKRVGGNSYYGSFSGSNGVNGSVSARMPSANRQDVTLNSTQGRASLVLRRRR